MSSVRLYLPGLSAFPIRVSRVGVEPRLAVPPPGVKMPPVRGEREPQVSKGGRYVLYEASV